MIHLRIIEIVLLAFIFIPTVSFASDIVPKLKGIEIKADNEAPQVTHIIPWKNPKGAERLYSPIRGSNIQRLKPMDPYRFELETSLHEQWLKNLQKQNKIAQD